VKWFKISNDSFITYGCVRGYVASILTVQWLLFRIQHPFIASFVVEYDSPFILILDIISVSDIFKFLHSVFITSITHTVLFSPAVFLKEIFEGFFFGSEYILNRLDACYHVIER
jgi:hypothetical protein